MLIENNKKFYENIIVLLAFMTISLYILLRILYPHSYSILNLMLGPAGSFDDTINQFRQSIGYFINASEYIIVPNLVFIFQKYSQASAVKIMLIYFLLTLIPILILSYKSTNLVWLLLICIHPILFSIFRGSFDHFLALYISISVILFKQQKIIKSFVIFLIATFIKPSTAILFGLLFCKKIKLIWLWILGISFLCITILSISFVDNGLIKNINVFTESLHKHAMAYYYGDGGLLFNNSIFSIIKLNAYKNCHDLECIRNFIDYSLYYIKILAFIFPICIVALFLFNKINTFTFTVFIAWISIFLLPVSPDYRLALLIIPLFLLYQQSKYFRNSELSYIIFVFIIFLPKSLLVFKVGPENSEITLSAIINPILSIIFIVTFFLLLLNENLSKK